MGNRGCQTSDEISKISLAALNPDTFLIEICDNRRVLIENHRGITCYGSNEIVIKVKQGSICVCGDHLYLSKMNKTKLVVSGRITAIQIQKG
jgi:sporulation protein YqfC